MGFAKNKDEVKNVAVNRKARHDYHILDTYEVGLVLKGTEVKSLREGKVSLRESFAQFENNDTRTRRANIITALKDKASITQASLMALSRARNAQTVKKQFP